MRYEIFEEGIFPWDGLRWVFDKFLSKVKIQARESPESFCFRDRFENYCIWRNKFGTDKQKNFYRIAAESELLNTVSKKGPFPFKKPSSFSKPTLNLPPKMLCRQLAFSFKWRVRKVFFRKIFLSTLWQMKSLFVEKERIKSIDPSFV